MFSDRIPALICKFVYLFYLFCLDVCLSSDFIAGFCEESEIDHNNTIELIRKIKYNFAFCFPYSMRKVGCLNFFLKPSLSLIICMS